MEGTAVARSDSAFESIDLAKAIPQGTADHVGRDMRIRQHVLGIIQAAYERFGFSPFETPALENVEVFRGRYGEGEENMFHLSDRHQHHLVLPYDSTASLARVMATHPELPKPYRGYNISRSFRDESGGGLHRELVQCSADVVGSSYLGDDAQFVVMAFSVLRRLGFEDFTIRINHRRIYRDMAEIHGIRDRDQIIAIERAIDHFDQGKGGIEGVKKELAGHHIGEELISDLLQVLELSGGPHYVLQQLENLVYWQTKGIGFKALDELREIIEALPRDVLNKTEIDLSLVRDLDYYTGFVIEAHVEGASVASVLRGGRYDDLIASFGVETPAVGMAFYFELILEAMAELGILDNLDVSRRRIFLCSAEKRGSHKIQVMSQALRRSSFEVVAIHEPLDNRFKRLKMAMAEECAFIVCLDGMISIKPLPDYGESSFLKVLQEALENNAFGDGKRSAVVIERETDEREKKEVARLGQPVYDFDPEQIRIW
ncbi:MAG: HisS family protein [Candidatus Paceibacterota bacterium]|jgi:histidyl-tRNA synthetase